MKFKLEDNINDYIKEILGKLGLKSDADYGVESQMSQYLKDALRGGAKTKNKTNFGKPDFNITKYKAPVIMENKLGLKRLVNASKGGIKFDEASIKKYAVNGALHYARTMLASTKYSEVIAIGCAADDRENAKMEIYYVYGSGERDYKKLPIDNLNFLENEKSFNEFYKDAILNESEKHAILIKTKDELAGYAKKLNKLMQNHSITAPQRVLYVSGMLLAMQDVRNSDGALIQKGLTPDDLKGLQTDTNRDGIKIKNQIEEFLKSKQIKTNKMQLMLASFSEISKDPYRDELASPDDLVGKIIEAKASINKQIFVYIYENIFMQIDRLGGHLDIMGELYSEFLKYALGDGKELGIVLTPPYVTKMMSEILNIDKDSRVMDLATGSAGFLISAMELMITDCEAKLAKGSADCIEKIEQIKKSQLLGVELNAEMYALAATNMILRGDGSSLMQKANVFDTPPELYCDFNADRVLLNPPFSHKENGMPFIEFGLNHMQKGGLGAIIIQDSAGSGKAVATNKKILAKHTLLASIKMPTDLFMPMAGVQTSIYIFKAKEPHDFEVPVKFIDFRNDGFKRTERSTAEIDEPEKRYADIIRIYKSGLNARVDASWDLSSAYVEDFIACFDSDNCGADWNFDQHKKIDTKPTLSDFKKSVSDYLAWEVSQILKKENPSRKSSVSERIARLETEFITNGVEWREFELSELFKNENGNFDIQKKHINGRGELVITSGESDRGVMGRSDVSAKIIHKPCLSIDMFGNCFARNYPFKMVTHARVFAAVPFMDMGFRVLNFIATNLSHLNKIYGYSNMATWDKIKDIKISLPCDSKGEINFCFMEKFISELENEYLEELESERLEELEAYLAVTGLKDYELNQKEKDALKKFDAIYDPENGGLTPPLVA
ncbi:hypothetical protein LBC_05130 [Campylobacter sp. 19-13652]|nr:hypothetical protein LBC_05130 [Campylobacter sp. 19-13652]